MKAQHEGALTPACIIQKNPHVQVSPEVQTKITLKLLLTSSFSSASSLFLSLLFLDLMGFSVTFSPLGCSDGL